MEITFKSAKLKKIFNKFDLIKKEYGIQNAKKIKIRMAVLSASDNLGQVPKLKPDRCHELKGKMAGSFAVDLVHPFRLIFAPDTKIIPMNEDKSINLEKITKIKILKVKDYH